MAGAAAQVLVSEAPGYLLQVPPEQVDVHRFRALVAEARRAAAAGDHTRRWSGSTTALALWRGPGTGRRRRRRPGAARSSCVSRRSATRPSRTASRRCWRSAVTSRRCLALQAAVDEHPLRERLWALLALALYRSSRQADALRRARQGAGEAARRARPRPGPRAARAREPHPGAGPRRCSPRPRRSRPPRHRCAERQRCRAGASWSAAPTEWRRWSTHSHAAAAGTRSWC